MSPEEVEKFGDMVKFGDVKFTGSFDSEQKRNISLLISQMEQNGITNPYAQIGILSVISKESGFKPKGEVSYSTTSNDRIRKIFGKRVAKYSDEELNDLKKDQQKFFNVVYSKTVGNQGGEDGWIYRGRGFNQLTGKKNYEKWGNSIGMGNKLVENPDLLNKPEVAAKLAVAFLTKNKSSIPNFTSKEDAAEYFADINAGGSGSSSHRSNAVNASKNFDVEIKGIS
jgi:predicted chitinase